MLIVTLSMLEVREVVEVEFGRVFVHEQVGLVVILVHALVSLDRKWRAVVDLKVQRGLKGTALS